MSVDATTIDAVGSPGGAGSASSDAPFGITIVVHPDGRRVGEHVVLPGLAEGQPVDVSRVTPIFSGAVGGPLDHPTISRKPLRVCRVGELIEVTGPARRGTAVDGQPFTGVAEVPLWRASSRGFGVELGGCVLGWVHRTPGPDPVVRSLGMVGISAAFMRMVRRLKGLAGHPTLVLLAGESGVGKELAARALHSLGPRRDGPFCAVNVAALPGTVATAELFGHERSAFTGAQLARPGWFRKADGGTLFLDEIGELEPAVQPLLLRALESGEIQPLGGDVVQVDTRLVAATDADLAAMVGDGRFRNALFQRLSAVSVALTPLRERPVDAGLLFVHFLARELAHFDAEHRLYTPDGERPWLRPAVMRAVMGSALLGNARTVRQLAMRAALDCHDEPAARVPDDLLPAATPAPPSLPAGGGGLGVAEVRRALSEANYVLSGAARALGVGRNTLLSFMRSRPEFNVAADLSSTQISAALDACDGDRAGAARHLGVSRHGLKLRMARLGMTHE